MLWYLECAQLHCSGHRVAPHLAVKTNMSLKQVQATRHVQPAVSFHAKCVQDQRLVSHGVRTCFDDEYIHSTSSRLKMDRAICCLSSRLIGLRLSRSKPETTDLRA